MSFSATTQLSTQALYCYLNSTHTIQIVCLVNSKGILMEKIIFPQQRILFDRIPEGRLEVYVGKNGKKVLQKIIYCQNLALAELELQLTAI